MFKIEEKKPTIRYSITNVVIPRFNKNRCENLRIYHNFEKWVNSSISLEKILESILEMGKFMEENREFMESLIKPDNYFEISRKKLTNKHKNNQSEFDFEQK